MSGSTGKSSTDFWDKPILSYSIILSPAIIAVTFFIIGNTEWRFFSWLVIAIIDIFLTLLLWQAAKSSDWKHSKKKVEERGPKPDNFIMPHRKQAFVMLVGFIAAVIASFALIYWHSAKEAKDIIERAKSDSTIQKINHYTVNIESKEDAVYFSFATMLTLGYGDKAPSSKIVKRHVMLHLISAFLLFFGAFPLFISRITDFSSNEESESGKSKPEDTSISDELKKLGITLTATYTTDQEVLKEIIDVHIIKQGWNNKTDDEILNSLKESGLVKDKDEENVRAKIKEILEKLPK